MIRTERGRAGGLQLRKKYTEQYDLNPNTCLNCGKTIQIKEGQKPSDARRKKFCNHSCAASYNNRKYPKREKRTSKCVTCGTTIPRKNKYCFLCSPSLGKDWSKITLGSMQASQQYQKSSRIRQLAREKYEKSDKPKRCSVCGYDKHFHVCHKKPINSFPEDTPVSEINCLDNLVALCPNHHWELDNGLLSASSLTG